MTQVKQASGSWRHLPCRDASLLPDSERMRSHEGVAEGLLAAVTCAVQGLLTPGVSRTNTRIPHSSKVAVLEAESSLLFGKMQGLGRRILRFRDRAVKLGSVATVWL